MIRKAILIAGVLTSVACVSPAQAATRYASTSGTGDCGNWTSACALSTAINASAAGDEVWVKAGTYGPIALANGVKIIGGFTGTETAAFQSSPAVNLTIIDGGGEQAVIGPNTGPSTMLRGFTIRNGKVIDMEAEGGGMSLTDSSALIVQCVFENNTAVYFGGAVAVRGGSSAPHFVNCDFHANGETASVHTYAGGAVYLYSGSPTFTNCLFYNNKSAEGAVLAAVFGSATFINCTITNNQATIGYGGAIFDKGGKATLRNCILWGNTAAKRGHQIMNGSAAVSIVSYSNVQGGWTGAGNLNADPQFESPTSNNYKLLEGSPCQNAGQNSVLPADVGDLDWDGNTSEAVPKALGGNARKIQMVVDLGAYETPIPIN